MNKLNINHRIVKNIATLAGLGFFPLIPGTIGALVGVLFYLFLIYYLNLSAGMYAFFTISCIVVSFMVCGRAEKIMGGDDPAPVIIDDMSGMLLTLFFVPRSICWVFIGFVLFRCTDVLKVWPSDIIEKKRGSIGIVGDDLIAGIYASILLQISFAVYSLINS